MKIEVEVKVEEFKNEWHKTTVNLIFTNNWLTSHLEQRANKKQITLTQFNVLRILRGQYPKAASNSLLKERMINNTPDISRLVERMVDKGLISKSQNTKDKRSVDLKITKKGLQLLLEIEDEMMMTDLLSSNLSAEEASLLSDLLDKFRGQ